MPVESHLHGSTSAVGRFPTAGDEAQKKEELGENETDAPEETACRRWLHKACWCCFRKTTSEDDLANTVVTGVDDSDGDEKEDKPTTPGDDHDNELDAPILRVTSTDLLKGKSEQNCTAHHTQLYQNRDLIIRRGQTFQMWITLSRPFHPNTDKIHLELKIGSVPVVSKGTHVIIPLVDKLQDDRWEAAVVKQEDKRLLLSVNSLPTANIGRYQLTVHTVCPNGQAEYKEDNVCILFNPWCEEDTVFMDSEEEKQEYVLNDVGLIYYGTELQIGYRTWDYGQFAGGILAACLYILEKSGTPASGWGDPVNVVRIVSAMVNSVDDFGVIQGNWSGNYAGGTSPTVWTGSVEILQQYHNNGTPVSYGQCWVFAGVVTTVLRCLGIPTRTVTNFSSAHDTDVSLTTDVYLDENLAPLDDLNRDSVWNFHVWNDCWMARPDLPAGMGGWQAVDATPQETSQGIFRCGPASLTAVRNGQVYLKHDAAFVFAEVNSDKIYWQRNVDGTFSQIYSEKKTVGHSISTKAVGSDERNDITHLYKHPEGTEEERIAVETACKYGSKAESCPTPTAEDVSLEVSMEGTGPQMGKDVDLTVSLKNSSSENRTVSLHSQTAVMYYTGVHKATVKRDATNIDLLPNEVKMLEWSLEYKDYKEELVDQAALMLTLSGRVKQTQQVLATQYSFRLRSPDLTLKPIGKAVVGKKMTVEILFTNPLPQILKGVLFHVEGLGLMAAQTIHYGDIASRASVSVNVNFVPTLSGLRKLLASLDCRQLTQVHGVLSINVEETNNATLS
ncbi:LOW QUALITY PROTEIN: protein-glutamine gamma-glutamyltransferase K-like [Boleophthalmus pectinirostris]|uniref:LOW QUALITY PROTEIN: protein-glutamine gamma-glutamyltransferase K-like n=1 Tax=Boleophthalmus pectinirostris TaxID=150288 RepID=UPI00243118E3|nr:LOW QUALITY PROTEIN: protein-glutamine gamma-glutamyltransferase K-like [Boleophthalmus pectinirostris]